METSRPWLTLVLGVDRLTATARRRHAADTFLRGSASRRDGWLARAYFELSIPLWAMRSEGDDSHLAPFVAGLEALPSPPSVVLDLGTGSGHTAIGLSRRFPDARVTGVDSAHRMVAWARRRNEQEARVTFVRARADRLPFADGTIDTVTLMNAMPEMHELDRVLAPAAQVLIANSYCPALQEEDVAGRRLAIFGFRRLDGQTIGEGSWTVLTRTAS